MVETLAPRPRSRSIIIVSLLLTLQGISFLILVVLISIVGVSAARNAVADHKPTAATLSTAFAVLGGGFFIITCLLVFLLAWGMWRQKGWAFWGAAIFEGLSLLISLAVLYSGISWLIIAQGLFAAAVLVYLFANRQVRAV
jgi:hypothetical protein